MKTIMASILAIGVSVSAMANTTGSEDPKATVSIQKMDASKIQLVYAAVPEGPVLVKIFDNRNFLIQNDRIAVKNAFSKKYDFSKIAEGLYRMEVYDQNGLIEKFAMDFTEVKSEPVIYSKLEEVEEGKYKLVINSLLPSDLSVFIYEDGRLIHEEQLENVQGFQKLYIFNKLKSQSKLDFFVKSAGGFSEMLAAR
jgi:hypothetical protein